MGRMTTLFIMVAAAMGVITFSAKQKVMVLEEHLAQTNQKILTLKESRHILMAEWSYLNEPSRLQRLVEKHLPINSGRGSTQFVSLDSLMGHTQPAYDSDAMVRLASVLEEHVREKAIR